MSTMLPVDAEHIDSQTLYKIQPVGTPWRELLSWAEEEVNRAKDYAKRGQPAPSSMTLIYGWFGMGKSLLARKLAVQFFRTYHFIVPIILPLRRLVKGLEQYGIRAKGFEAALEWYLNRGYELVEPDKKLWAGVNIGGERIDRLGLIQELKQAKPNNLLDISDSAWKIGVLLLLVIDEAEALITPGDRDLLAEWEISNIITHLINNSYQIAGGGYKNILVILTSVFSPEDWVLYLLKAIARDPTDQNLKRIAVDVLRIIEPDDWRRLAGAVSPKDRDKIVEELTSKAYARFVLMQSPTRQRMRIIGIRYSKSDYRTILEKYLGLKLDPGFAKPFTEFLEAVQLSIRTLINLAQRAHQLNNGIISTFEELGKLLTNEGRKEAEYKQAISKLMSNKVIPKHTKWPIQLLALIKHGAIVVPSQEKLEEVPDDVWQKLRDLFLKLCPELGCRKAKYLDRGLVYKIVERIHNNLYLKYKVVEYIGGYYMVDEYVVRWFLDDPIDRYGETTSLEDYLAEHHKMGKG